MAEKLSLIWLVRHIVAGAIGFFIASLIVVAAQIVMPDIEGEMFPVARIIAYDVEPGEDGTGVVVTGVYEKFRDCDIHLVDMHINGDLRARRKRGEQIVMSEVGIFDLGPWYFDEDLEDIRDTLKVVVTHECHPFWDTRSVFLDAQSLSNTYTGMR